MRLRRLTDNVSKNERLLNEPLRWSVEFEGVEPHRRGVLLQVLAQVGHGEGGGRDQRDRLVVHRQFEWIAESPFAVSARCTAFALTPRTRAMCVTGRPRFRSSTAIAMRSGVITVGRPGRRPSLAADAIPARVCRLESLRLSASSAANISAGSTMTPEDNAGSVNERNPTPRFARPLTTAKNWVTVGAGITALVTRRVSPGSRLSRHS
jgi:hypothetical protein